MARPFRFGYQLTSADESDPVGTARRVESAGFDVLLTSDHIGLGLSPMPTLAAAAAATSTLRVGTFVLNSDMRNPVQLAWEASTLDHLSGGRFELGLGAGHTLHEYAQTGIELLAPSERKSNLAERVDIIRRLLDGETVDHEGEAHTLADARIDRTVQDRLPILVGGNGAALLGHAGTLADIMGLQGLGRTQDDGHRHDVKWSADHLDAQLEQVRVGACHRFDDLEFNALVQVAYITDDPVPVVQDLCARIGGLEPEHVAESPYALIGTVGEIVEKLHRCRERWGISYFAVRSLDSFAPVIAACR